MHRQLGAVPAASRAHSSPENSKFHKASQGHSQPRTSLISAVNASEPSSNALTPHTGKGQHFTALFLPRGGAAQPAAGHAAGRHSSPSEANTISGCEGLLDLDRQGKRIPFAGGSSTARPWPGSTGIQEPPGSSWASPDATKAKSGAA